MNSTAIFFRLASISGSHRRATRFIQLAVALSVLAVCCVLTACGGKTVIGGGGGASLAIATSSLPSGQVGVAYSATLTATGGVTPYTWSLVSGTLPAGLAFAPATGVISGTPTAAAKSVPLTFQVTDSSAPVQSKQVSLSLTVAPPPVAVSTSSLPSGQVGVAYSATLAATGGTQPYSWALTTGTLPAGLQLHSATGVIDGTPTAPAHAAALTFTVTDSSTPALTRQVSLTLTIAPATLAIVTSSLPGGQVGTPYSATLAATGGTLPYTWTLSAGTLPAGIALSQSSGLLSGTPTASAIAAALTFTVSDSSTPTQSKQVSLSLTIAPRTLTILTTSLPNGQVGSAYSATLAAAGGTTPYTWALAGGTLPAGISLNPSTGVLGGTPTASVNAASLSFTVTDSSSPAQSKQVALNLTIVPQPLSITTSSLPNGQVNAAYSATLAASGGTLPYTWALTSGALPAGITLNTSTGGLSGTPTAPAHAVSLTFTVTDSSSPVLSKQVTLSITIAPLPLSITTASLPNGQVNSAYTATLAATGGTLPYTWTLTGGDLPTGLILHPSTGVIDGTPTSAINADSLTFTLTDSSIPALTKQVSLAITIAPLPLTVTTTSLPNGQVGVNYTATLEASNGTLPYNWYLIGGTLPTGLNLKPSTGVISGTPLSAVTNTPLTFILIDSSNPAQKKVVNLTLTITPPNLAITTGTLPDGEVGVAYSASLVATGGTTPYTWSLTSGTLPASLSLNPSTGAITGTPAALVDNTPLTFKVTDSSSPAMTQSVNLTLSIVSVSITPRNAGVVINQSLSLYATIQDSLGVRWSASGSGCSGAACGVFSASNSLSGVAVTYTAPSAAGVYTLTATSISNSAVSASARVGVTDLAGVTTYHNDGYRDGLNSQEYALTTSNVSAATFGKLASCPVDAAIYTQPLWVPNLTIASATHNVVFVATQNDSLYAFDADSTGSCTPLWHANLIDSAHGGTTGETSVPSYGAHALVGYGAGDIAPEVGVTGTPVIDLATNTLYVVSKSAIASGPTGFQRIHAIDLITGNEKFSGPTLITATAAGTGGGGSTDTFNPLQQNQRPALALAGGVVYVAWASHEDRPPYFGWIIGYNASNLAQASVLNITPNGTQGGIWMAGGAPAIDSSNNLYVLTANGPFDVTNASPPNDDYGDSLLKLSPALSVLSYFTPSDELSDEDNDQDFGSAGGTLIDLPANGGNPTHLIIGGGKDGFFYLLNRDHLGGSGNAYAWQRFYGGGGLFSTGAYWNHNYYFVPAWQTPNLEVFTLNPSTATMSTYSVQTGAHSFGFPGTTPSISTTPTNTNAIVWALDNSQYCTPQSPGCGPAVLYAYDATNVSTVLWNSTQGTGNTAGLAVKFQVPTVANGKVYVGTRGNNAGGADNSTSTPGELEIYGLLPN